MYAPLKDGFAAVMEKTARRGARGLLNSASAREVEAALARDYLRPEDFLALLSPAAAPYLEITARRAQDETLRHFGRAVQLFTPLYLANYCTNRCVYCGFSARRAIRRSLLTPEEVEAEAAHIAATGLRKILALTGDAPAKTGPAYLASCIAVLARHFSSVSIEVPSMTVPEYAMQVEAGADGMTMFQETYNRERYPLLHPAGPKSDYFFRLDAPERAALGGMRALNLGPLLGLDDWRSDVFYTGLHAEYLLKKYPEVELSVSLPRMRPHVEGGEAAFAPEEVDDRAFVQALTALRCYLPQIGITMSTREPAALRDRLLPLGVTRVSAGVSTAVGGHLRAEPKESNPEESRPGDRPDGAEADRAEADEPQFDISDNRSVEEMCRDLRRLGYQPVFADWLLPGRGDAALAPGLESALRC